MNRSVRQRNDGIRKLCGCSRRTWPKCSHPWHFNFKWAGESYRFSLARVITRIAKDADGKWQRELKTLGDPIDSKTAAEQERDRLRAEIRAGRLQTTVDAAGPQHKTLTLTQLLDVYNRQYIAVHRPAPKPKETTEKTPRSNTDYQIRRITCTAVTRADGAVTPFGDWLVVDITTDTIETFRAIRMAAGVVAANRDLALLRALFNWATSKKRKLAEDNPFLDGSKAAVRLQQEHARRRRLRPGEGDRLLAACGSHLRAVVEAALETGCRKGELLSLQWRQVRFAPKAELLLPAGKTKTKRDRSIPISARLRAILEMRRNGPDDEPLPDTAYVFGTEIGEQVTSFKRAWERAVLKSAGVKPEYVVRTIDTPSGPRKQRTAVLTPECRAQLRAVDLHFHDLRREAGSRWLDAGVPLHRIQKWLGHANISQTSTYLLAESADDDEAMRQFEARRAALQQIATDSGTGGQTAPPNATIATDEASLSSTKHH